MLQKKSWSTLWRATIPLMTNITVSTHYSTLSANPQPLKNSRVSIYLVHRVRKTALTIARSLPVPPDLLVVELGSSQLLIVSGPAWSSFIKQPAPHSASLLHDVLDKKYVTPAEAEDPYTYFLPLFKSIASTHSLDLIQDGRAKLISKIVSNVSWSNEKKLRKEGLWSDWHEACLELHCVQDADRLDAIGAFGTYDFFFFDMYITPESSRWVPTN